MSVTSALIVLSILALFDNGVMWIIAAVLGTALIAIWVALKASWRRVRSWRFGLTRSIYGEQTSMEVAKSGRPTLIGLMSKCSKRVGQFQITSHCAAGAAQ